MKELKFPILFFVLSVFSACVSDLGKFEFKSDAKLLVPVAHGSFSVDQLIRSIDDDSLLQSGADSSLVFVYSKPSFKSVDLNELIDFTSYLHFPAYKHELGLVSIDDMNFEESLSLNELKSKLPDNIELSKLEDQKYAVFSNISYDSGTFLDAPEFQLPGNSFNFSEAVFSSGEIILHFKNNLPVPVKGKLALFDSGHFLENINFGLLPSGNKEEVSIKLDGKTIVPPLSYRLLQFSTEKSDGQVLIETEDDIQISVDLKSLKVSQGILNEKMQEIELPPDNFIFDLDENIKLTKAVFDDGTLDVSLNKSFSDELAVTIDFLQIMQAAANLKCTIVSAGSGEKNNQFSLDEAVLDLNNDDFDSNVVPYKVSLKISSAENIHFNSEDFIELGIQIKDSRIKMVEGDLGNQIIRFDDVSINLDLDVWDQLNENLVIKNPVLKLFIDNPLGFSSLVSFKAMGINRKAETASMEVNKIQIDYPKTEAEGYKSTEIVFDNSNCAIEDLLALPPDSMINISGEFEINPGLEENGMHKNFINFDKTLDIGFSVELPVLIKGSLYSFHDTIEWSGNVLDSIQGPANIYFRIINKIPLGVNLDITPFDLKTGIATGAKIEFDPIEAALIDDGGNVLEATETEIKKTLTLDEIKSMREADSIIINAEILSPGNGADATKLKPGDSLVFYIYVELETKKNS